MLIIYAGKWRLLVLISTLYLTHSSFALKVFLSGFVIIIDRERKESYGGTTDWHFSLLLLLRKGGFLAHEILLFGGMVYMDCIFRTLLEKSVVPKFSATQRIPNTNNPPR